MGILNYIYDANSINPLALIYGVEVVLPLELQIPLFRIAIRQGLIKDENHRLRLTELKVLDEKTSRAVEVGMLESPVVMGVQQKGTTTLFPS